MQLKTVLDWEPVDIVWNSLDVAGAMILVIQEEDTALKDLHGDQWSLLGCTIMRWFLIPVFVLKKRTMSGPLSSVQVIKMWWKWFQFGNQEWFILSYNKYLKKIMKLTFHRWKNILPYIHLYCADGILFGIIK